MTRQELFDSVVKHCNNQGVRSISRDVCRYRSPGGLSCGIGGLMPDKVYRKNLEGHPAPSLPVPVLEACGFDMGRDREWVFANDLQGLHDNKYNWIGGRLDREAVMGVAKHWGLEVPK